MVFDLECSWSDLCVAEEVHEELTVEITDTDGFGHALANKLLHGRPSLLNGGFAGNNILAVEGETGWVSLRGVDVFQRNWEVDNVEVEIVDTPVFELLFADGLDAIMVVEGVPEFGYEEEIGAFDNAFFDGAGDTLAGFLFVAVVWEQSGCACLRIAKRFVQYN